MTRQRFAAILYAAASAYAAVRLWRFPRWTVDDAYIVFRYAKHLVDHGQLAWNVGGPPVEGTTGIALPLLVAGAMRAGLPPTTAALFAGVGGFALAAWTLRDNQRLLGVREPVRAYVTSLALLSPGLYAHATGGLETMLFAGLLGACFGAMLRCWVSPRLGSLAVLWTELLVLSLVRPEGVLCAAVLGGLPLWRMRRGRWRRALLVAFVLYALPFGAYFGWRVRTYGRLLPNTYYAKLGMGLRADFVQGLAQLLDLLMPAVVAGVALAVVWRRARIPRPAAAAALGILVVATLQYSRSVLIMGYLLRFQVHYLFLWMPLLGVALQRAPDLRKLPRRIGPAKRAVVAAAVVACLLALPVELIADTSRVRLYAQRYLDVETEQHARIGTWLRDHLASSESIACWVDAGLIPYLASEHRVIDFGRLNDPYLAQPGITPAAMAQYFFAQRPGALIVTSLSPTNIVPAFDGGAVTEDRRFSGYEARMSFCSPEYPQASCEVLFLRRGVVLR